MSILLLNIYKKCVNFNVWSLIFLIQQEWLRHNKLDPFDLSTLWTSLEIVRQASRVVAELSIKVLELTL